MIIKNIGTKKINGKTRCFVLVKCEDCGEEREIRKDNEPKACLKCSRKRVGKKNITHNMSRTSAYLTWDSMVQRTTNKKSKHYNKYKDKVPNKKWLTFGGFWEDMGSTYKNNLTLDRIDNSKGYSAENCRWADRSTQSCNRSKQSNNTTGYKGVYRNTISKSKKLYFSRVHYRGENHHLGSFETVEAGAIAYNDFVVNNDLPHELNKIPNRKVS